MALSVEYVDQLLKKYGKEKDPFAAILRQAVVELLEARRRVDMLGKAMAAAMKRPTPQTTPQTTSQTQAPTAPAPAAPAPPDTSIPMPTREGEAVAMAAGLEGAELNNFMDSIPDDPDRAARIAAERHAPAPTNGTAQ